MSKLTSADAQQLRPLAQATHTQEHLVALLGRSLGEQVARDRVAQVAGALGLGGALTVDQALAILEQLARGSDLVSIAARFAKARVHLAWSASHAA